MKRLFCSFVLLLALANTTRSQAQDFTLAQLITLHKLIDLPAVEAHLEHLGWRYSESSPEERIDQVSWKHHQKGGRDAVVNVFFCNLATNKFCDRPDIHAGSNAQHTFMVLYQPSASTYQLIKREAERNKMELMTTVMDNSIRYQYTGANYIVTLERAKYEDGVPRYFVELKRKTSVPAE